MDWRDGGVCVLMDVGLPTEAPWRILFPLIKYHKYSVYSCPTAKPTVCVLIRWNATRPTWQMGSLPFLMATFAPTLFHSPRTASRVGGTKINRITRGELFFTAYVYSLGWSLPCSSKWSCLAIAGVSEAPNSNQERRKVGLRRSSNPSSALKASKGS